MNKQTVAAVAKESGVTKDEVTKVLEALEAVTVEPAVGTIVRNPATGDVAVYVRQYAETYWRVYATDDRTWIEPELVGWDVLHEAAAVATTPGEAAVDPE
jgi:hypothetical protein